MRYEILLAPGAVRELNRLAAVTRSEVRAAMEEHLRHQPTRTSKSRIKRLRGIRKPEYRLRVGEIRVFYDVRGRTVEVLAIIAKAQAERWLAQEGVPDAEGSAGES
jgi:mRNA-degrading endonuclease RelE of RelBE toxin-antitoxin system